MAHLGRGAAQGGRRKGMPARCRAGAEVRPTASGSTSTLKTSQNALSTVFLSDVFGCAEPPCRVLRAFGHGRARACLYTIVWPGLATFGRVRMGCATVSGAPRALGLRATPADAHGDLVLTQRRAELHLLLHLPRKARGESARGNSSSAVAMVQPEWEQPKIRKRQSLRTKTLRKIDH